MFRDLLVRPKGFEPLTFCSVDRRSIQLSYGRVFFYLARRCEPRITIQANRPASKLARRGAGISVFTFIEDRKRVPVYVTFVTVKAGWCTNLPRIHGVFILTMLTIPGFCGLGHKRPKTLTP